MTGEYVIDTIGLALYDMRCDPDQCYDVKAMYPEIVEELDKLGKV